MMRRRGAAFSFARLAALAAGIAALVPHPAIAADSYWINNAGGNFGDPAHWKGGVPSAADNACFTNHASPTVEWTSHATASNALFRGFDGIVTLNISNSTWSLLNSLIVEQLVGPTASVAHVSGTLVITNAGGTGSLIVGQAGNQTFSLQGGTLTVDRLLASNSLEAGVTNSFFNFDSGVLNVLHGSSIVRGTNNSTIGRFGVAIWNVRGGTNVLEMPGTTFLSLGDGGGCAILNVSGSGTVFSNTARFAILGHNGGAGSQFNVSDGATVYLQNFTSGYNVGNATNTSTLVTGPGSQLFVAGGVGIGHVGSSNSLIVADGGRISINGNVILGDNALARSNAVLVTGSGSTLTISAGATAGSLYVGLGGGDSCVTISNGGAVTVSPNAGEPGVVVGGGSSSTNNLITIIGPGSALRVVSGPLLVRQGAISITDHGQLLVTNSLISVGEPGEGQITMTNGAVMTERLQVSTNGSLAGCGLLIGSVVNHGSISNNCVGGTMTFSNGVLTNAIGATIVATGGVIDFEGPVVNEGLINGTNGTVRFKGGLINTGTVLTNAPQAGSPATGEPAERRP